MNENEPDKLKEMRMLCLRAMDCIMGLLVMSLVAFMVFNFFRKVLWG